MRLGKQIHYISTSKMNRIQYYHRRCEIDKDDSKGLMVVYNNLSEVVDDQIYLCVGERFYHNIVFTNLIFETNS